MRKLFAYAMSFAALLFAGRLSAQTPSHQASPSALDTNHSASVFADGHVPIGSGGADGSTNP